MNKKLKQILNYNIRIINDEKRIKIKYALNI